jgi:hypothetical protein
MFKQNRTYREIDSAVWQELEQLKNENYELREIIRKNGML